MTVLRSAILILACGLGSLLHGQEDPFALTPELRQAAWRASAGEMGGKRKAQALLQTIYRSREEGGFGITYDNAYTRDIQEVWRDRKANCLSMSAFFVALCASQEIPALFAETWNTGRWRRVGSIVRYERHVVVLLRFDLGQEYVADFLPDLRKRTALYRARPMGRTRMLALYRANRAVELLETGAPESALAQAELAVKEDAAVSTVWNIRGVVLQQMGRLGEAEASFRQALRLDPGDATPIGNLEYLLRGDGRLEEALRWRMLGQRLRQHDPYYHAFLAEEAQGEGRLAEALKEIRKAIKLHPFEPEFHLSLARICRAMDRTDDLNKAIAELRRVAAPEERRFFEEALAELLAPTARPE